jgi:hypothetical protein
MASAFYDTASPPAKLGYEPGEWEVTTLLNPPQGVLRDWRDGGTDYAPGDVQILAYNRTISEVGTDEERTQAQGRIDAIETARTERRAKLGRALHALYGTTRADVWDFTSPETALTTIERDDVPEEVIEWLLLLPGTVKQHRQALLVKELPTSYATSED